MLKTELQDSIRIVTLDRPDKSNSLHPDLISSLAEVLERTDEDDDIHVVLLTGAGTSFCAGLDLDHLVRSDMDGTLDYMRSTFALFRQVYELRQPVVAAVNGPAIAGGFDLAAFCDLRLCSTTARFAQTEILLGLTQIMYPLYKVIGLARAKELALTGEAISADEAHRIGLVSGVFQPDELLPAALELARKLASQPREALFETKRLSREVIEMDTDAANARMLEVISSRLRSDEHREAVESYVERLRKKRSGGATGSPHRGS